VCFRLFKVFPPMIILASLAPRPLNECFVVGPLPSTQTPFRALSALLRMFCLALFGVLLCFVERLLSPAPVFSEVLILNVVLDTRSLLERVFARTNQPFLAFPLQGYRLSFTYRSRHGPYGSNFLDRALFFSLSFFLSEQVWSCLVRFFLNRPLPSTRATTLLPPTFLAIFSPARSLSFLSSGVLRPPSAVSSFLVVFLVFFFFSIFCLWRRWRLHDVPPH